jgi:hypothetical protein
MRPADRAWLVLGAGVIAWDALCPKGDLLSDASERYTAAHPVLWRGAIIYTAGHLMHVWPEKFDLFTLLARRFGR